MSGDSATPPPTSGAASAEPGFEAAYTLNQELLWTLHSPDSWARAITAALFQRARGVDGFQTGAAMEMTLHEGRVRVSLRFASLGQDSAVDFSEVFVLTI
jgi:hypothetical protein